MDKPLIVLTDPVHEIAIRQLEPHFDVMSCEEFRAQREAALARADAAIIRSFRMTAEAISACPRLKVISKHGAGIDNIDLPTANRLGVVVANVPGGNADAVAEAAVALMLGAIWRIPQAHSFVVTSQFQRRWELHFEQLTGRTLGLLGFGNIGQRVARICRGGFNMRVLAYDPFVDAETMRLVGVEKAAELDSLLGDADVVSLHMPLTAKTQHLIGRRELRLMKKRAVLINTARGKLVDGDALRHALQEQWIGGAGLDVFEVEPPEPDDPLLQAPNLVTSPHSASFTNEADMNIAVASCEIAIDVLAGRKPKNFINPEIWPSRRQ
jgi:D-3-phosphoglycerate dehydrogenase / 2-oxoglutarate reductase